MTDDAEVKAAAAKVLVATVPGRAAKRHAPESGRHVVQPPPVVAIADAEQAQSRSTNEIAPGRLLCERYEVRRLLGEGGMGAVFAAYDRLLDHEVAIKVVREDFDELGGARLRDELLALQRVTHPSVLRTYTLEEDAGRRFIVMEFLRGKTLAARLRDADLPLADVTRIGEALLGALAAAHAQGLTHRDVKPSNLFLCDDGRVVLLDFGLARSIAVDVGTHTDRAASDLTRLAGTPGFMAPEVIAGGRADARADAYAVGVVLYEMVTRRHPYEGANTTALLENHRNAPVPDPAALRPNLPPSLGSTIIALLNKDPAARPHIHPGLLRPPRARRWPAIAAISVFVIAGAGITGWATQGHTPEAMVAPSVVAGLRPGGTEARITHALSTLIDLPGPGNGCTQLKELLTLSDESRLMVSEADVTAEEARPRLRQLLADPEVKRRLDLLHEAARYRNCEIYPSLIPWPEDPSLMSMTLVIPSIALVEHFRLARFAAAELERNGHHAEAIQRLRDLIVVGWQLQDERLLVINMIGVILMGDSADQLAALPGNPQEGGPDSVGTRWRALAGLVRERRFDEFKDLFQSGRPAVDDTEIARLASIVDSPELLRGARGEAMERVSIAHLWRPGAPPPTATQRSHFARWVAMDDPLLAEFARVCARVFELDEAGRRAAAAKLEADLLGKRSANAPTNAHPVK